MRNLTSKKIVVGSAEVTSSIFRMASGWMFTRKKVDESLVFDFRVEKKVQLHMCFVFYPIDILLLNSKFKVVVVKEDFRPFSFYNPVEKCRYVCELPSGSIRKSGTKVGHKIEL